MRKRFAPAQALLQEAPISTVYVVATTNVCLFRLSLMHFCFSRIFCETNEALANHGRAVSWFGSWDEAPAFRVGFL